MIPTVLLPLVTIPLTGTGKINRRELRQVVAGLTRDEINSYVPTSDDTQSSFKRPPGNEIERQLHVICAQLLNIDLNTIGIDDDFFRLGGDSISAMQVAAKAKAVGLAITAADILSRKSIAGMASSSIKSLPVVVAEQDSKLTTPFDLSSIQCLFFETIHENHSYFNQSFSLRLSENVDIEKLDAALRAVVAHHAMLRAQYRRDENDGWVQQVQNDIEKSYVLESHSTQSTADAVQIISDSQQSLDIFNGPLLRADLIETHAEQQHLFLVAQHLVMDLVSWRIILADLEKALRTGGELSASPSLPFSTWSGMQAEYDTKKLLPAEVFPF